MIFFLSEKTIWRNAYILQLRRVLLGQSTTPSISNMHTTCTVVSGKLARERETEAGQTLKDGGEEIEDTKANRPLVEWSVGGRMDRC